MLIDPFHRQHWAKWSVLNGPGSLGALPWSCPEWHGCCIYQTALLKAAHEIMGRFAWITEWWINASYCGGCSLNAYILVIHPRTCGSTRYGYLSLLELVRYTEIRTETRFLRENETELGFYFRKPRNSVYFLLSLFRKKYKSCWQNI